MGSIDSAFGGNFEGSFEPDDFYESFLAPKFHDFTVPEEAIDPDAYFMAKPGMPLNSALLSRIVGWALRLDYGYDESVWIDLQIDSVSKNGISEYYRKEGMVFGFVKVGRPRMWCLKVAVGVSGSCWPKDELG